LLLATFFWLAGVALLGVSLRLAAAGVAAFLGVGALLDGVAAFFAGVAFLEGVEPRLGVAARLLGVAARFAGIVDVDNKLGALETRKNQRQTGRKLHGA
jgi:hypothetical protein